MKNSILLIALILALLNCVFQMACAEDNALDKNEAVIIQVLSSNNVQAAISILPEIERLWLQQPKSYFYLSVKAAGIVGTNNDPASKQALLNLFTNMVQKPFPTNNILMASCLKQKKDAVCSFLNYDEIRNEKVSWIAMAKYIGEIRSHIILNFTPKKIYLNVDAGLNPTSEEMNRAIEENEQNKAANNLQQSLHSTDRALTFFLLHNASRFPSSISTNANFNQEIISLAHLTAEEQSKLQ